MVRDYFSRRVAVIAIVMMAQTVSSLAAVSLLPALVVVATGDAMGGVIGALLLIIEIWLITYCDMIRRHVAARRVVSLVAKEAACTRRRRK
jgi:hypothetical protein